MSKSVRIENLYKIRVVETKHDSISVDVPEDVARVEELLKEMPGEK